MHELSPDLAEPQPGSGPDSGYTELHLGALDELRVSLDTSPAPTLLSLVCAALGGPGHGIPKRLVHRVRRTIPVRTAEVLSGVISRPSVLLPNCVGGPGLNQPVRSQIEEIAETSPDLLLREVLELHGQDEPLPEYWQLALRNPRHWLAGFATAMGAAWQVVAPVWQGTKALRARETERVGVAVVSGSLDALLVSMSPRSAFADTTLYLPDTSPYRVQLGGRRVVLLPMASGSSASVFNLDEPDLVWFGYPVPGIEHLAEAGMESQPRDSLALLLGPIRAGLLRVLAKPVTMGRLAAELRIDPSKTTYHCKQLVAAGLVTRARAGREVRVRRTLRGDALVDLLS